MKTMRKRANRIICAITLVFLSGIGQSVCAQLSKQQKLDSLKTKWQADSTKMQVPHKYGLLAGLDRRSSFVSSTKKINVRISGAKAGVTINGRHSIAVGYYDVLNLPQKEVRDESDSLYLIKLNMNYLTLFYEYHIFKNRWWEIGVMAELGGGGYHTTATDTSGKKYRKFTDTLSTGISVFGTGVDVTFKIFKWLGFNGTAGYRFVGGKEPAGINFNGVFYSVGFEVYFGQLYKMTKFGLKRRTYRNNVEKVSKLLD